MGHHSLSTTALYLHVATHNVHLTRSPLTSCPSYPPLLPRWTSPLWNSLTSYASLGKTIATSGRPPFRPNSVVRCTPSRSAAQWHWAGISMSATPAATRSFPTTPAAIDTVPSVNRWQSPVAAGPPGRTPAGRILSCHLHSTGRSARTTRSAEPTCPLQPSIQGRLANTPGGCRRPPTSRCTDWIHRRLAHLGPETQPSSPSALRRPRRRFIARWKDLDCLPSPLLPECQSSFKPVPGAFPPRLEKAFHKGELEMHGKIQHLSHPQAFAQLLASCRQTDWVVYSQPPFGDPKKSWITSDATPIASPSPITGW